MSIDISGWDKIAFKDLIVENKKSSLKVSDASNFGNYNFYTSGESILKHHQPLVDGENIYLATGGVANIKYENGNAAYSTDTYSIKSKEDKDAKYLYYYVLNYLKYINDNFFQGSGLKHLQKKDLKQFLVNIPNDLNEQKKIAEILTKVDEAIENTEQLIQKYEQVKVGLMQDLLTKGIDEKGNIRILSDNSYNNYNTLKYPNHWFLKTVSECIAKIDQGWSPNCLSEPASVNEWGVLKTSSVTWEGFKENENKKLPYNLIPKTQFEIKDDDVLITRAGPNSRVGVVSYIRKTRPKLILSDKIYRLNAKKNIISNEYLALVLTSDFTQYDLSNYKTGMAESQTNISQKIILGLKLLVPELKEQSKIISKINNINDIINNNRLILNKINDLKQGLMQDLLSGKVRVNY